MLNYDIIKTKLQDKISDYSKREVGDSADFYARLVDKLQKQLDNLNAHHTDYTLQDLIVAWQTYRECIQERKLKFYTQNKYTLIGAFALVAAISVNIFHRINKKA